MFVYVCASFTHFQARISVLCNHFIQTQAPHLLSSYLHMKVACQLAQNTTLHKRDYSRQEYNTLQTDDITSVT